jgi:hypothetical protein
MIGKDISFRGFRNEESNGGEDVGSGGSGMSIASAMRGALG